MGILVYSSLWVMQDLYHQPNPEFCGKGSAHLARDLVPAHVQRQTDVFHIGASVISRIGFWGILYYNYSKELPR